MNAKSPAQFIERAVAALADARTALPATNSAMQEGLSYAITYLRGLHARAMEVNAAIDAATADRSAILERIRANVCTTKGFPILKIRWGGKYRRIEIKWGSQDASPCWTALVTYKPTDPDALRQDLETLGFNPVEIEMSLAKADKEASANHPTPTPTVGTRYTHGASTFTVICPPEPCIGVVWEDTNVSAWIPLALFQAADPRPSAPPTDK